MPIKHVERCSKRTIVNVGLGRANLADSCLQARREQAVIVTIEWSRREGSNLEVEEKEAASRKVGELDRGVDGG